MVGQRCRNIDGKSQEEDQIDALKHVVSQLHWMARRYADGRMTYATSLFNECTRKALDLGCELNPTADETIWARDGMGEAFDGASAPPRDTSDGERPGPLLSEVARFRGLMWASLEALRDCYRASPCTDLYVRVSDLTGLNFANAKALCREFGSDPEERRRPAGDVPRKETAE